MERGKTVFIETNKLVVTNQPMESAGTEDVERLKQSIRTIGLLYPLLIRSLPDADTLWLLQLRFRSERMLISLMLQEISGVN